MEDLRLIHSGRRGANCYLDAKQHTQCHKHAHIHSDEPAGTHEYCCSQPDRFSHSDLDRDAHTCSLCHPSSVLDGGSKDANPDSGNCGTRARSNGQDSHPASSIYADAEAQCNAEALADADQDTPSNLDILPDTDQDSPSDPDILSDTDSHAHFAPERDSFPDSDCHGHIASDVNPHTTDYLGESIFHQ